MPPIHARWSIGPVLGFHAPVITISATWRATTTPCTRRAWRRPTWPVVKAAQPAACRCPKTYMTPDIPLPVAAGAEEEILGRLETGGQRFPAVPPRRPRDRDARRLGPRVRANYADRELISALSRSTGRPWTNRCGDCGATLPGELRGQLSAPYQQTIGEVTAGQSSPRNGPTETKPAESRSPAPARPH